MDTYNKYFNDAWDYLKELHPSPDFLGSPTLDLSKKPHIKADKYCYYIDALVQLITIGQREQFISLHVDGHGHAVYIKY